MKKLFFFGATSILALLAPVKVSAHCPLCTGGAGAAAVAAAYFGVAYGALGVFLGGFATALSLWLAHKMPKQYIKHQAKVVFWVIYISTVIPFYYMFKGDYVSHFVSVGGEYGSVANRTYLIDLFLIGAAVGSLVVYIAPTISNWLTKKRAGSHIKFQGLAITFLLLAIAGLILQVWPR